MVPVKGCTGISPGDGWTGTGMVTGTSCVGTGGCASWEARDDAGAFAFGVTGDAALASVFGFFATGPVSDIALARLRWRV